MTAKAKIDFTSADRKGVYGYFYKSVRTGKVFYCQIDHDNHTYTTDFKVNGGCMLVRLKDVKAAEAWAKENGYLREGEGK